MEDAGLAGASGEGSDLIVPNPKLKLLDQVREVMRLKHYSIRTERSYADWVRRYVHFHRMKSREEMLPSEPGGGLEATNGDIKATSQPVDSQAVGTPKPPQSHPNATQSPPATSMRPQCDPKATPEP